MIKDSAYVLFTRLLVVALNFSAILIIARILGPTDFGSFSVVTLIPSILFLLGSFGVNSACVYYIGKDRKQSKALFSNALYLSILIGVAIVGAFVFSFDIIAPLLSNPVAANLLKLVVWTVPFLIAKYYTDGILQGLYKIGLYNYSNIIYSGGFLFILLMLELARGLDLAYALTAWSLGYILSVSFAVGAIASHVRGFSKPNLAVSGRLVCYGFQGYAAQLCMVLLYRVDILFVNYYAGAANAGYYTVASRLTETLWLIPDAVSLVLFPKLMLSLGDSGKTVARVLRHVMMMTLVTVVVMALLAWPLITIVFGREYLNALSALLILLPGVLFATVYKVVSRWFFSEGRPMIASYIALVALIANIALNIVLIPVYGINGAALASTICYAIVGFLSLAIYSRRSGIGWPEALLLTRLDLADGMEMLRKVGRYRIF